jgi:hypothetical protein
LYALLLALRLSIQQSSLLDLHSQLPVHTPQDSSQSPHKSKCQTDPSVAKQYDSETDKVTQIKDFFSLADEKKIGILNTYRNGVGT